MSLKLKKLVIHEGCSYLKRLQPNTYEFLDNRSIDNFTSVHLNPLTFA